MKIPMQKHTNNSTLYLEKQKYYDNIFHQGKTENEITSEHRFNQLLRSIQYLKRTHSQELWLTAHNLEDHHSFLGD
jgi:hypothetical protein